jgi:uncharacterized protein YbjT (DUF2867 family)
MPGQKKMEQKKIILVTGATGAQGGSVARFLLEEGKFAVRCLTRNPTSGEAIELAQAGAEIIQGSFDDMDSLLYAMQNVYGVFGVTNYWEHFEKELQHGKNLVNAVAASNIDYFIYSSLPAAEKISKGKFKLPHFDNKAGIQEYAKSLKPDSTFVHVAGYYENFSSYCLPQKASDGNYYLQLPQGDTKYASFSVEDLGGVIRTMFRFPEAYRKRTVGVVGSDMHCAAYAAIMSKVLGINILYKNISRDEYIAQGFPGAEELGNMYTYNKLHIPDRQLDLIESYGLYPGMQSFETWVIKNKKLFEQVLQLEEVAINQ